MIDYKILNRPVDIIAYSPSTPNSWLGAAIGLGSSIIGGLIGSSTQSSSNKTNLKIAQMNNEYNERMLQEQLDYNQSALDQEQSYNTKERLAAQEYNTGERLATQQYNSAIAQRQRLEAAGLNPYMMMNGGSAGTATSQSIQGASSPSALGVNPSTATPVQVHPYDWSSTFNSIGNAISHFMDWKNERDQVQSTSDYYKQLTEQVRIENQYKAKQIINDMNWKDSQRALAEQQEDVARMDYLTKFGMYNSVVNQARYEAENTRLMGNLMQGQVVNEQLKAQLQWKELQYFDDKSLAELAVAGATASNLYASGYCSYAAAKNFVANAIKAQEETNGIRIDNDTKKKVQNYVINDAFWNNRANKWTALGINQTNRQSNVMFGLQSRQMGADYWNPFGYIGKALGGSVSYSGRTSPSRPTIIKGFR